MSKSLYINNKRVTIDTEKTYFPFSYKINDLENINIIGVPVSKTIEIPRCVTNDEIFGYIGNLTHITIGGENNLIGISFNQTKKAFYELYNDSELVSEGTISIVDVNENTYSILLFDALLESLDRIEGNTDTGEGFLNELDIKLSDNSTFEIEAYATNVKNLIDNGSEVKPCVNIKEYDNTGTDSYIKVNDSLTTHTLLSEMTPVQFQTLKPYQFEYSLPISTVIRSINDKYDLITYDEELDVLFDEVHFNCGVPKPPVELIDYVVDGTGFTEFDGWTNQINGNLFNNTNKKMLFNVDTTNIGNKNGNYYLEIPLNLEIIHKNFNGTLSPTQDLCTYVSDWGKFSSQETPYTNYCTDFYGGTHPNAAPYGTYLGSLYVDVNLAGYDGATKIYSTKPITYEIRLLKGVNVIETLNYIGNITKLNIQAPNGLLIFNYDYYHLTQNKDLTNYIEYDFSNFSHNPNSNTATILFSNIQNNTYAAQPIFVTGSTSDIKVKYKSIDFRCGDKINGQSLFPKISIKEFIIETVKYFNLVLKMVDGKLNIQYKKYYLTDDVPIIGNVNSIDIHNFDFSRLTLKNEVTSNQWFEEYQKYTKKTYGEKIVTTGYNIKLMNKDITFGISSPGVIRDVERYAYDIFGSYFNGGYSKHLNGVTEGLEDKLVFGYVNNTTKQIYCQNDTQYEAGLIGGGINPEEVKFVLSNTSLNYTTSNGLYTFSGVDDVNGTRLIDNHLTLLPYKFDSNYNVVKSTEINKPVYNYANITDDLYSDDVTLYSRYHKKYIQDIYNVNTHILDVDMYIDGVIDEYKIYNYNNSYYIISEVPEYDPTQPDIYNIKLLRVNDITNYTEYYGRIPKTIPTITTNDVSIISYFEIGFGGTIESNGNSNITEKGLLVGFDGDPLNYDDYVKKVDLTNESIFFGYVTGLTPNILYNYRVYAINEVGISYGEIKQTSTLTTDLAIVTFPEVINLYSNSIQVESEVLFSGLSNVTERGFCWDYYPNEPSLSSNLGFSINGSGMGTFTNTINNLIQNTDYNVISYATNNEGTSYSELIITPTTAAGVPIVTISSCIRQLPTFVNGVCTGEITNDGGSTVTASGFVYSTTNPTPTLSDSVKNSTDLEGIFGATINNMSGNIGVYYIRAFATNSIGTGYSSVINDTV